ncbi:nuclear transport factor 2 family protein [Streptomyces sp. NPDC101150]|uniref:nuclear transport factor 2 family protein n=1 Tax=Streptomyces sp. NPDC101150 TaxID=3366114 RepID=UPI00380DB56C
MTTHPATTRDEIILRNREIVAAHLEREVNDLDAALDLYTDDVVWEAPGRGVILRGKEEIKANYQELFSALTIHSSTMLRQVVCEEWVFNDKLLRLTLTAPVRGLAFPPGSELSVRKLGAFEIRDGLICREISHESWRPAGHPTDRDDLPPGAEPLGHP